MHSYKKEISTHLFRELEVSGCVVTLIEQNIKLRTADDEKKKI